MRLWPTVKPLVMLHSAGVHEQWGRWSVLSSPSGYETIWQHDSSPLGLIRTCTLRKQTDLEARSSRPYGIPKDRLPFSGGLIGYFSYDLGRVIEPAAQHGDGAARESGWPLAELAQCPAALVYDHLQQHWHIVGDPDAGRELIEQLGKRNASDDDVWHASDLNSLVPADTHLAAVSRTLEYIAEGDIYQANITQQIRGRFAGCTRAFARHALAVSGARYGAYLELPEDRCIVSMSPELFLHVEGSTRQVTTRPIKGTRPHDVSASDLRDSTKDAAELHMITDLMRNDLGRVCEYGSVQVVDHRSIESHPTVHHGVSTITGRLRSEVEFMDLLAATFPGGSVTGAPKIRAMQVIEELERQPRGPYCGAIGMISSCGNINLNIAIRTVLLQGTRSGDDWSQLDGVLTYGAGGGIVADSDPLSEYRESMDKMAVLRLALKKVEHKIPK